MIRTFKIILAFSILGIVLGIVPGFAWGQSYNAGTLKIEAPWVRATPAGAKVAGGYMTIMNSGAEPDRLIGGTLPQAGRFEVHEMKMDGAMMQMRPLPGGLEIGPGQKVELKPSG